MEWVETTGATVAAALDAALDELGVDDDEVEYQVLQEPKAGLFGRLGGNPARIRARVKPVSREKPGDRQRGGRGRPARRNGAKKGSGTKAASETAASGTAAEAGARSTASGNEGSTGSGGGSASGPGSSRSRSRRRGGRGRSGGGSNANAGGSGSEGGHAPQKGSSDVETQEIPIGEQADAADEFVRGLLDAASISAEVSVRIEEDTVLVDVEGDDLGVLVGPKGVTLRAIEDLVRTIVQRRTDGHGARIHVDVGGYQAKRRAALEQFSRDLARRVVESGNEVALEPMPPADRKVVHDTVSAIDGVATASEGEEPRRRVVIRPV
jgi:spoIIIJ-associated protein